MIILATILTGLSLLMSVLLLVQPKVINLLDIAKLAAGAFSPIWAMIGLIGALIGGSFGALWTVPMGILSAGMMILYIWRCTRDHKGFENAFGADWSDYILPQQIKHMVKRRWSWFLKTKASLGAYLGA